MLPRINPGDKFAKRASNLGVVVPGVLALGAFLERL